MSSLPRRSIAEALGTFALVFIGTGVVASKFYPDANFGVFGIAVAHAMVLSVMITATMSISGGYLNPAVTIGLLVARRLDSRTAVSYIISQLVGAILASLLVKAIYPGRCHQADRAGHSCDCQQHSLWPGGHHRGGSHLLPGIGGVRNVRQSRRAEGRRLRCRPGAAVRHSGWRSAHRLGRESGSRVRSRADLRSVGGPDRVLGGTDPRRDRGGVVVGARAVAEREG